MGSRHNSRRHPFNNGSGSTSTPLADISSSSFEGNRLNAFELNHKIQSLLYAFAKETKVYDPKFYAQKSRELLEHYLTGGDYPGITIGEIEALYIIDEKSGTPIEDAWGFKLEAQYQGDSHSLSFTFNAPSPETNRLPGIYEDPFTPLHLETTICSQETLPRVDRFARLILDYGLLGGIYRDEAIEQLRKTHIYFWPGYSTNDESSPVSETAVSSQVTEAVYEACINWPDLLVADKNEGNAINVPAIRETLKRQMEIAIFLSANGSENLRASVLLKTAIGTITDQLRELKLLGTPLNTSKAEEFLESLKNYQNYCSTNASSETSCEDPFIASRYYSRALQYLCLAAGREAEAAGEPFDFAEVFTRLGKRLVVNRDSSKPYSTGDFLTEFFRDKSINGLKGKLDSLVGRVVPSDDLDTHNLLAEASLANDNFRRILDSIQALPINEIKKEEIIKAAFGLASALDGLDFDEQTAMDLVVRTKLLNDFLLADLEHATLDVHTLYCLKEISGVFGYAFQDLSRVKRIPESTAVNVGDREPEQLFPATPEFKIKGTIAEHLKRTFNKTAGERSTARLASVTAILGHGESLGFSGEELDTFVIPFFDEALSGCFRHDEKDVIGFGNNPSKSDPYRMHPFQLKELAALKRDFLEREGGPWAIEQAKIAAQEAQRALVEAATKKVTILMVDSGIPEETATKLLGGNVGLALAHERTDLERFKVAVDLLTDIFGEENIEPILTNYPNLISWITWGYLSEKSLLKLSEHKEALISGTLRLSKSERNRAISWKAQNSEVEVQGANVVTSRLSEKAGLAVKLAVDNGNQQPGANPSPLTIRLVRLSDTSGIEDSVDALSLLDCQPPEIAKLLEEVPALTNPIASKDDGFGAFLFTDLLPALELVGVSDTLPQRKFILAFSRCINPNVKSRAQEFIVFCSDAEYCPDESQRLSASEITHSITSNKSMILYGTSGLEARMARLKWIFENNEIPFDRKDILVNHAILLSFVNITDNGDPEKARRDEQIVTSLYTTAKAKEVRLTGDIVKEAATLNPVILKAAIARDKIDPDPIEPRSLQQIIEEGKLLQEAIRKLHTPARQPKGTKITSVITHALNCGWTEAELIEYIVNFKLGGMNPQLYTLGPTHSATIPSTSTNMLGGPPYRDSIG